MADNESAKYWPQAEILHTDKIHVIAPLIYNITGT